MSISESFVSNLWHKIMTIKQQQILYLTENPLFSLVLFNFFGNRNLNSKKKKQNSNPKQENKINN